MGQIKVSTNERPTISANMFRALLELISKLYRSNLLRMTSFHIIFLNLLVPRIISKTGQPRSVSNATHSRTQKRTYITQQTRIISSYTQIQNWVANSRQKISPYKLGFAM